MENFIIIEDHPSVRMSIKLMIRQVNPGVRIHEFSRFQDATAHISDNPCDLVVMDINVPGGDHLEMPKKIKSISPKSLILVYSGYDERIYGLPYLTSGADGFLSKKCTEDQFVQALRCLLTDRKYISPVIQGQLFDAIESKTPVAYYPLGKLTDREKEIMNLMIAGKPSKEICAITNLKMSTISTFKLNIFKKMNVENTIDLYRKVDLLRSVENTYSG